MTHNVTIENNTSGSIRLNLLQFFTRVDGSQVAVLAPGGTCSFQAMCYPPQVVQRFRQFCSSEGIVYGRIGLNAVMEIIEGVEE